MVKYLIIEDERLAYEELKRMVSLQRPDYVLAGWCDSIEQAKLQISSGNIDLMFLDIHLADGLAFEIFDEIENNIPVIYTTAYDEYALKAFKVGDGVDYLLKPVQDDELATALDRFEKGLLKAKGCRPKGANRQRFLVRTGDSYRHIPVAEIAYFQVEDRCTFIHLRNGKAFIVDSSLDLLETELDGNRFFRISRNCIINIDSIGRCNRLFGGRLCVHLADNPDTELIVSRNRATDFLDWIDGIN